MLFVGWFLQFVIEVASWLLPCKRSSSQPAGYDERQGMLAVLAMNVERLPAVVTCAGTGNTVDIYAIETLGETRLLAFGTYAHWLSITQPRA